MKFPASTMDIGLTLNLQTGKEKLPLFTESRQHLVACLEDIKVAFTIGIKAALMLLLLTTSFRARMNQSNHAGSWSKSNTRIEIYLLQ